MALSALPVLAPALILFDFINDYLQYSQISLEKSATKVLAKYPRPPARGPIFIEDSH
jgi:hypothetical protein